MDFSTLGKCDLHTHTTWSDGRNTTEEMVLEAIARGADTIGISDHSFTSCDLTYCMKKERYEAYVAEINALKKKYEGQIKVLCGIEQDYEADFLPEGLDYLIGSMHYFIIGDDCFPVDDEAWNLVEGAKRHFDGDIYALIELYYETMSDMVDKTHCDIIGHFDVIKKFNQKTPFFDENHPRVLAAQNKALDRLLKTGVAFEINTGAISRGYRDDHYPADRMIDKILAAGSPIVFGSDSHTKDNLFFDYENIKVK